MLLLAESIFPGAQSYKISKTEMALANISINQQLIPDSDPPPFGMLVL